MISSAIRAFFLCLLGMVLLVSCREKGFLSIEEAVAFSEHAPLSAADAYACLEDHLNAQGRRAEPFARCVIRDNEYYFLTQFSKTQELDGYAVHAHTGKVRRVRDNRHVRYPYSVEEQHTKLFLPKRPRSSSLP